MMPALPSARASMAADWEVCSDALLRTGSESLELAATRAMKRARRFGLSTRRTQVARIILGEGDGAGSEPMMRIRRAAAYWRSGEP
jgi:hypothetical protein